jgi:hypothetical protein
MSLWCPTLDPHLTIDHSNKDVYTIVVLELNTTLLERYKVWLPKEAASINKESLCLGLQPHANGGLCCPTQYLARKRFYLFIYLFIYLLLLKCNNKYEFPCSRCYENFKKGLAPGYFHEM